VIPVFVRRLAPFSEESTPDLEIICVNDGSAEAVFDLLFASSRYPKTKIASTGRNFDELAGTVLSLPHDFLYH